MNVKLCALVAATVTVCAANLQAQSPPTIAIQPTNQPVGAGSNVTFSVSFSGTGPITYQWQFNGTNIPNDIITTVVGNGTYDFSGDGGPATNASMKQPSGVVMDASGNLFIADTYASRVRKVGTNGIIRTVAGNGVFGSSGDDGPATNASMRTPFGLAVDAVGNLFIADTNSYRIRKVDTNGIITTVAGNGISGYSGDGVAATNTRLNGAYGVAVDSSGNLFIADTVNNRVRKVDTNGIITTVAGKGPIGFGGYSGDGGPATNASLSFPMGVAVDAFGNLFIANRFNQRIRKVDTNGIITTVAGNSTNTGVGYPGYVGGYSGDGGPATNASLFEPSGVIVDASGNLFIADKVNQCIRKVDANGIITTVAGKGKVGYFGDGGSATNARLNAPFGVTLDVAGNLFIADSYNNRIRKVGLGGFPTLALNNVNANNAGDYTVIISGAFGSVTSSIVTLVVAQPPSIINPPPSQTVINGNPASFSVTAFGALPLSFQWQENGTNLADGGNFSGSATTNLVLGAATTNDAGSFTVVITNAYGSVTSSVAVLAVALPGYPIIVDPASQSVWQGSNATFSASFVGAGAVTYQWQRNGTNILNNIITTVAGNGPSGASGGYSGDGGAATNAGLNNPLGVAVDASGNLFISDASNNRIRKIDVNNIITTVAGNGSYGYSGDGGAATNASFRHPYGVAVDSLGNLYISDRGNTIVRKVDTKDIITTFAGNGNYFYSGDNVLATNTSLSHPSGVAVDTHGNLFIADYGNNRVRKVDTDGYISTVAGGGSGGDGGAATNASLSGPNALAVDTTGNLFIVDYGNYGYDHIRKVDTNGIITTVADSRSDSWVTLDASGELFMTSGLQVIKADSNSTITTVAGNGNVGFSGDGGPATNASLYSPQGVAVDASANLYIADSLNNRIRKVGLNGSPMLPLNNVTPNDAGDYTVIISGAFGSVTSSIVTLTVLIPPSITGIVPNLDGSVTLDFAGGVGQTYLLQATTNLTPPVVWQTLSTNVAGTDGTWQFSDTNALNYPAQFYRSSTP